MFGKKSFGGVDSKHLGFCGFCRERERERGRDKMLKAYKQAHDIDRPVQVLR